MGKERSLRTRPSLNSKHPDSEVLFDGGWLLLMQKEAYRQVPPIAKGCCSSTRTFPAPLGSFGPAPSLLQLIGLDKGHLREKRGLVEGHPPPPPPPLRGLLDSWILLTGYLPVKL
jgi:hypothetical protein